ncbi:MAG: ABC transporter ATP-binding protein [Chthonomonas sp.]|nr:ABC transporter ATP-binding protein [Chthonomonas sp.]
MIRLDQASLVYREQAKEVVACAPTSLEFLPGQFYGILGPSGSGKSSLLYLASGLKAPSSGNVTYRDQPLGKLDDLASAQLRQRSFGFVFQFPYLLGYLSLHENVCAGRSGADFSGEAAQLLSELGLADKMHRFPHEVSGGERQRTCVARALLGRPEVIFADEPTASLDHTAGHAVVELLQRLRGEGTLIMVTHDPTMIDQADHVIEIVDGEVTGQRSRSASARASESEPA